MQETPDLTLLFRLLWSVQFLRTVRKEDLMASDRRVFSLGERVYQVGRPMRWAVVVGWPPHAAGDLLRMKVGFMAVRLERHIIYEEEEYQFWPKASIRREGESDQDDQLARSLDDEE